MYTRPLKDEVDSLRICLSNFWKVGEPLERVLLAIKTHDEVVEALKAIREYSKIITSDVDRSEIKAFVNNAIDKAEGK